jgi:hypothetical protein
MRRDEIIRTGNRALIRDLGLAGMIQYIQYFNSGSGTYEKRRKNWQFARSVADLAAEIGAQSEPAGKT